MKQISSVDLHYLIQEFQILVNQRIETFYFDNKTFFIKVYIKGQGNQYLTNNISNKSIYLDKDKTDMSHPNNFISFLRKYLKSSFIREVTQIDDERIIKITMSQRKENILKHYFLYIELFANGNIILADENNQIMNSLTKKKYKDRVVMNKEIYELPPKNPLNLSIIDEKVLEEEIKTTDLPIVKFLAIKFGIGGKFAEELCHTMNIDKNEIPKKINQNDLIKHLKQIKNQKLNPHIQKIDNKIQDIFPVKFTSKQNLEPIESFNQAIKEYAKQFNEKTDIKHTQYDKELKKLQNRLKKQEETKEKTIKDYEKNNEIGTKIFENYSTVEDLLNSINKAAKEKGWDHVKNQIKNNEQLSKIIKKLDYKNDSIILNLN